MSGRAQPLHGADSADALDIACPVCDATYTVYETTHSCAPLRQYRVLVCDRFDEDRRFTVRVAAAIGPYDARSQVRESHPNVSVLAVEEVASDRGRMQDEPSYVEDKDAYYDLFGSGER